MKFWDRVLERVTNRDIRLFVIGVMGAALAVDWFYPLPWRWALCGFGVVMGLNLAGLQLDTLSKTWEETFKSLKETIDIWQQRAHERHMENLMLRKVLKELGCEVTVEYVDPTAAEAPRVIIEPIGRSKPPEPKPKVH